MKKLIYIILILINVNFSNVFSFVRCLNLRTGQETTRKHECDAGDYFNAPG